MQKSNKLFSLSMMVCKISLFSFMPNNFIYNSKQYNNILKDQNASFKDQDIHLYGGMCNNVFCCGSDLGHEMFQIKKPT